MQIAHHQAKRLIALSGMALLTMLTQGCYTPSGTYYRQPVTYVPESPGYAPTYSYPNYPVYQQVVVPMRSPRYAWSPPCPPCPPPPPCHRVAIYPQECSWRDSRPSYEHRREEHHAPSSWEQRQRYAARPTHDRNFPSRADLPPRSATTQRQAPPPPAPCTTFQQHPSLANNQDPSTR